MEGLTTLCGAGETKVADVVKGLCNASTNVIERVVQMEDSLPLAF